MKRKPARTTTKRQATRARTNLRHEIARLQNELDNAQETLRAIRNGEVDALVVSGEGGERVFTLKSADLPYRILVETMNEGAATLGVDGTILYCNQRFAEMIHVPLERVMGSSIHGLVREEDRAVFVPAFDHAKRAKSKCTLGLVASRGTTLSTIFSMSSVELETGPGVCLVATDLTEQKRLEQASADVERLQIERDLRERFVSTLSHDLRNPLAAVKTSAQMIVRYPDQLERHQAFGNRIIHAVERADQMIQNLLDANRVRAGEKLPLQLAECDLRQTTEDALAELAMQLGDRFVLVGEEPLVGYWACDQLRRVVENLATNAVKYGQPGTPVRVTLKKDDAHVALSVHNQGHPLTREEQADLFRPFARTLSAQASSQRGWGLGLTLVRGVAEAHGGSVEVESAPRKGTTFTVRLPRDSRPFQDGPAGHSTAPRS